MNNLDDLLARELKRIARDVNVIKGWVALIGMLILMSIACALVLTAIRR